MNRSVSIIASVENAATASAPRCDRRHRTL